MGTTLTGTTPQDTYDSLIKVTDNGPIGATAKFLSDGLGNDSVLALSTSRVTIGGTNPYVGLLTIYGSASLSGGFGLRNSAGTAAGFLATYAAGSGSGSTDMSIGSAGFLEINTAGVERMRITSAGNVGIGTATPDGTLEVVGGSSTTNSLVLGRGDNGTIASNYSIIFQVDKTSTVGGRRIEFKYGGSGYGTGTSIASFGPDGLAFGTDSAAANSLDDYEEGTWTMGISFGGASVGVTSSTNTGTYTKIGRQVTVNGYLVVTSKGSSTGAARLTGLPFTVANTDGNYSPANLWLAQVAFTNQFQAYAAINSTTIEFWESTELGTSTALTNADFANNSNIMVSLTYFV
jgi:hypothetical protein